jgi:hypothetical protein
VERNPRSLTSHATRRKTRWLRSRAGKGIEWPSKRGSVESRLRS